MSEALYKGFVSRLLGRAIELVRDIRESKNTSYEYTLEIPKNIYIRTELICRYVSEDEGYEFDMNNFLMLLYIDFIEKAIKKYDPKKTLKYLSPRENLSNKILLSNGEDICEVERIEKNKINLVINIEKEDAKEGRLILDELYELYRVRISFRMLLENLWIGFIEDYQAGANKKTYEVIVNMLKEWTSEDQMQQDQ